MEDATQTTPLGFAEAETGPEGSITINLKAQKKDVQVNEAVIMDSKTVSSFYHDQKSYKCFMANKNREKFRNTTFGFKTQKQRKNEEWLPQEFLKLADKTDEQGTLSSMNKDTMRVKSRGISQFLKASRES